MCNGYCDRFLIIVLLLSAVMIVVDVEKLSNLSVANACQQYNPFPNDSRVICGNGTRGQLTIDLGAVARSR